MSGFSDGGFDIAPKILQERLEKGISLESLSAIEKIVESVCRLSNVEKLLLYLKLPTYVPAVSAPSDSNAIKTSRNTENVTQMWIKSHLTANENTSILRQRVYDDYRLFCETHAHESVSLFEFRRILQSVFPHLTMRRLGSRGNAKHVFGGIAYQIQPHSFTLPKLTVKAHDDNVYCDDEDESEGIEDSGRLWKNSVDEAAVHLVLEWAFKLLNVRFQSICSLAEHLITQNYVSQVSVEAFTVAAATKCELIYKDDVSTGNSTQKQLHTRHQLQKKIHERRELSRQKQRMEEERSSLFSQDPSVLATGKQQQQNTLSLMSGVRNPPGGSSGRTHPPKTANEAERILRKPILPKTLLPKLPAPTMPAPSRPILSIDLDHHAAQQVDQAQFILVQQNISHFQHCTPGPVVLISNTPAASSVPPSEAQASLRSVGGISLAPLTPTIPQSGFQNLLRNTDDLKAAPGSVVSVGVPGHTECSYSSPGSKNLVISFSGDYIKNSSPILNQSTVSKESINSGIKGEGVQVAAVVSQGSSVMSPPTPGSVTVGPQGHASQSVSLGSTSKGNHVSQDTLLLSPDNKIFSSGSDKGFDFTEVSSNAAANAVSPGSRLPSVHCTISSAKLGVHSKLALCQSSRTRSRYVTSRAAPKTVSSILDEQRCQNSGISRALYNDSRNVSQILKELREKHATDESSDFEKGSGCVTLPSEQQNSGVSKSCVSSSIVNLAPHNIQIVNFLPQPGNRSTDKIILDLQSVATMQVKNLQSSSGLAIHPKQPTAGGLPAQKKCFQSPSKFLTAGQISSGIFSSGAAFQSVQSSPVASSPLLLLSPTSESMEQRKNMSVDLIMSSAGDAKMLSSLGSTLKCTARGQREKRSAKSSPFSFLPSNLNSTISADTQRILDRMVSSSAVVTKVLHRPQCTNLQKLLLRPVQTTSQLLSLPSHHLSSQNLAKSNQKTVGVDGNSNAVLSWSNYAANAACSSSVTRNSMKRSATALPCTNLKRILMDNEPPDDFTAVRSLSCEEGIDDGLHFREDPAELSEVDMQMVAMTSRLHSPGELQDMLYKDTSVQHCTLQQLSNLQQMKMRYQMDSQPKTSSSAEFGSRPASVFGSGKASVFKLAANEAAQPSRPNTVATAVWDDQNIEVEAEIPFVESGRGRPRLSAESCGSESSTPMSIQSPRSNISCGSLYLDQSSVFMPLNIADALPAVPAIRPLPKHGQWQSVAELDVAAFGKLEKKKVIANFTTTSASGFTPYPSLDLSRVGVGVQPEGFTSVATIHPAKRLKQSSSVGRQRHHSAHEVQDSCVKTPNTSCDNLTPPLVPSSGEPLLTKLYSVEPSAFSTVSASYSVVLPIIDGPGLDLQELETADEVSKIICASQDTLCGNSNLQISHRSQSEPANSLQASYPLDPYDDFPSLFNSVSDLIPDPTDGGIENPSSRASIINWESLSMEKNSSENSEKLVWRGLNRGDHLISGIALQPSLSFPDADLNAAEFVSYENSTISTITASFVGTDCSPPDSQDPSSEFEGEMQLFDKPVKELDGFHACEVHSTALDTPNSIVGILNTICGNETDGQKQSLNCNVEFCWPQYF